MIAPASGKVTFYGESNKEFIVEVDGRTLIHVDGDGDGDQISGSIRLVKDRKYPIEVKYLQPTGGTGFFEVQWSWSGRDPEAVSPSVLSFTSDQAKWWNLIEAHETDNFDWSSIKTIPVENTFAYREAGRFSGWPANNGAWIWGNEIVVGMERSYHDPNAGGGHAIRSDKPRHKPLSRSLDGGQTWTLEDPDNFTDDEIDNEETYRDCPSVDFAHPDFAMRVTGGRFFVSYDRCKSWEGPYRVKITGKETGPAYCRNDLESG